MCRRRRAAHTGWLASMLATAAVPLLAPSPAQAGALVATTRGMITTAVQGSVLAFNSQDLAISKTLMRGSADCAGPSTPGPITAQDWTPNGVSIAVADVCGKVYTASATGSSVKLVANLGSANNEALRIAFSPAGDSLLMEWKSSVDGTDGVSVVPLDGTAAIEIPGAVGPRWSPDGDRIAFACQSSDSVRYKVCTSAADGSDRVVVPKVETINRGFRRL